MLCLRTFKLELLIFDAVKASIQSKITRDSLPSFTYTVIVADEYRGHLHHVNIKKGLSCIRYPIKSFNF